MKMKNKVIENLLERGVLEEKFNSLFSDDFINRSKALRKRMQTRSFLSRRRKKQPRPLFQLKAKAGGASY